MAAFVLKRLLATIPVMGMVAVVVFLILRLSPGNPAAILAGDAATPEIIAGIRANLGLDRPIIVQFGAWVWQLLQGDLGTSLLSLHPVSRTIGEKIGPTVSLAATTITFAVLVAVPLGAIAACEHRTLIDPSVIGLSAIRVSL